MTQIEAYQKAVNEIDDYFEYRFESQQDKEFVIGALCRLCDNLIAANQAEIAQTKADILRIGQ